MALDLSGATPPTPRANPRPKTAGPRQSDRARAQKTEERAEGLKGLFGMAAFGCMMFGGRSGIADAGAFATHGEGVANEAAAIAESNETFAKTVDFITAIGPFAGLLAASMPLALQILLNHGRIPNVPQLAQFGVVTPELMVQRAELEAQKQQMEMARQMQDQADAIRQMQAEYAANAA